MATLACALALAAPDAVGRGGGADGRFEKRTSSHFVLYQDVDIDETGGLRGSRRFEQQVLAELEDAYDSLDRYLGLRPPRKIEVFVYDPRIFDAQFGGRFRFPIAGVYNGVIYVRGATRMHTGLQSVLHHELVHAAFDAAAPSYSFPAWLNEGVAEWFSERTLGKRHLNRGELAALQNAASQGGLFSLSQLSAPSYAGLGNGSAQLAYLQSYATIEYIARTHGERAVRELCTELVRTRNLHRTLRRVLRTDLAGLERRFLDDLS